MMKQDSHKKNKFFLLLLYPLVFFILTSPLFAQNNLIEYKIKAGYLYNFTKFITWPENNSETFNLCILGEDPFGSILDPIEKRTVKDKPIKLYRLQTIKEAGLCHIVYFDSAQKVKQSDLFSSGILTISSKKYSFTGGESKQYNDAGGMISFFLKDGKIKLHINLRQLRLSQLDVSAKLLEIAEIDEGVTNE